MKRLVLILIIFFASTQAKAYGEYKFYFEQQAMFDLFLKFKADLLAEGLNYDDPMHFDFQVYTGQTANVKRKHFQGEANTIAYCHVQVNEKMGHAQVEVVIDPVVWSMADKNYKESIMYHEMAHCLLGLEHDESLAIDEWGMNVPVSIMHPMVPPSEIYHKYKKPMMGVLAMALKKRIETLQKENGLGAK